MNISEGLIWTDQHIEQQEYTNDHIQDIYQAKSQL